MRKDIINAIIKEELTQFTPEYSILEDYLAYLPKRVNLDLSTISMDPMDLIIRVLTIEPQVNENLERDYKYALSNKEAYEDTAEVIRKCVKSHLQYAYAFEELKIVADYDFSIFSKVPYTKRTKEQVQYCPYQLYLKQSKRMAEEL